MEKQIGIEFQMWNTFSKWTTKECTGGHFHVCNSIWIFLQYTLIWKLKKKVHSNGRGRRDLALNHTSVNYYTLTRKHSSRMRTVRCSGCRGGGGIPACTGQGGCVSQHALGRGMCIPACTGQERVSACGCLPRGVCPGGCLPYTPQAAPTPPCEQNDRCLWKHNFAATTLQTVIMKNYWYFMTCQIQ